MMDLTRIAACAVVILCCLVSAGCMTPSPAEPAPTVDTPTPTAAPAEPTASPAPPPAAPILVVNPPLYGTAVNLSATPSGDRKTLVISVHFDSTNPFGATGKRTDILVTFFAYNLEDVTPGFIPATADEVKNANVPYKTRKMALYSNNVITLSSRMPDESSQGSLSLGRPYNYGAIVAAQD